MQRRVLQYAGLRAKARQQRHLSRQVPAQGVDGVDAQAPRLFQQVPAMLGRNRQHLPCQTVGPELVRQRRRHPACPHFQAFQNAHAHFCSRLVGEGNRDDFLGLAHGLQQAQITLRQQLGLARPGRRLDDEGGQFQGAFAVGGVLIEHLFMTGFHHAGL